MSNNLVKNLNNKKIIIGITGGIASYKVCELIRLLIKTGADVRVILTPNAREFVTETTLSTLTKNQVFCEQFYPAEWKPEHISLADDADLLLIAPASANTIGKIANGICDNLLTSVATAFSKQVILAPAMNCNMWDNPFVQQNIKKLEQHGYQIIMPESGNLACGYEGVGRLADVQVIFDFIIKNFEKKKILSGKKILITAGGTKEPIDPVRYIGNRSSGKMGIAIADAAYEYGADVSLISTVDANKPYFVFKVNTAIEMYESVKKHFCNTDVLIMAAAVADFRPVDFYKNKIKKENKDMLVVELVKNPDILKEMAAIKKSRQIIVGFCAESKNVTGYALKKLDEKNLDFIVANDISLTDSGFNSDFNEIIIINKTKQQHRLARKTKQELGYLILQDIFDIKDCGND